MHAAFKVGPAFAGQVMHRSAGMIVQVMAQIGRFLIEALLWQKGLGFKVYTVLFINMHDAQAQPFVEHHPRADVRADLGHQGIKRSLAASTRQAWQG
ncbi:hypothetical protein D3C76_1417770 [compost metagenome]